MRLPRGVHWALAPGDEPAWDIAGGFWGPYSTFIVISLGYGVVAGSLVSFVEPLAGGSGIPEIKTYLNGIHIKCVLSGQLYGKASGSQRSILQDDSTAKPPVANALRGNLIQRSSSLLRGNLDRQYLSQCIRSDSQAEE